MASTALEMKPIDAIAADDVRAFVVGRDVAESQTLEFKQQASAFKLRRAIVALANAYGGTFVLGVVEQDHVAVNLLPIANCVEEANRIGQSVAAAVSPPIVGLRIRGVPIEGSAGVVVIRVPASPRRPHGTTEAGSKEALHVFVRRNLETKPADMREVQDMTLVAASRAQRVQARIDEIQAVLVAEREAEIQSRHRPVFQLHLCAVPTSEIALPQLDADDRLRMAPVGFEGPYGDIVMRHLEGQWSPIFRGLRMTGGAKDYRCEAKLHADGACEIRFWSPSLVLTRYDANEEITLHLEWMHALSTARILWCEKIARAAEETALEFALGDLISCDYDHVELALGGRYRDSIGHMIRGLQRPVLGRLASLDDVQRLLNQTTVDFYNLAGKPGPTDRAVFDLTSLRRSWGLADG